jgi:hypothetical protein
MKACFRISVVSILLVWLIVLQACTTRNAIADREKLFRCLTLDPAKDYIFYGVIKPDRVVDHWAIDSKGLKPVRLPETLSSVQMSTPPGRDWLLFDDSSIHILDLKSCKSQPVYTVDSEYKYLHAEWLGKDLLLITAFEQWPFSPDLFVLDLKTHKAERVASEKHIQAISPTGTTWIQADGITLEAVRWPGPPVELLKDFEVVEDIGPGAIEFLPHSEEFIFVAAPVGSTEYKVWKSSLDEDTPVSLFELENGTGIDYRKLSPDGTYLGLVLNTLEGYSLLFLNMRTNRIDYEWPYPFTRTNPEFQWSPDSRRVVMPYEGTRADPPEQLFLGIQIIDIRSGEIEIVHLEKVENFMSLYGWYSAR